MNLFTSVVRTVIAPTLFGFILQALALLGVNDPSAEVRAAVTAVLAMAWYIAAKLLSTVNPRFGVMLIIATQPQYVEGDADGERRLQDDLGLAVRRTVFPILVGWAVPAIIRLGITIDTATATLLLQSGFTTVYYGLLRWVENRTIKPSGEATAPSTAAGVMLGGPAKVVY